MRFPLASALLAVGLSFSLSAHGALITSFSDNFDGDLNTDNWMTIGGGGSFFTVDGYLTQVGSGNAELAFSGGTLPTATDFANGYSWTASVDLYISNPAPIAFGMLANSSTVAAANMYALRFRGNNADGTNAAIQAFYRGPTQAGGVSQQGTLFTATLETWYTLTITATSVGSYVYSFTPQGGGTPLVSGTLVQSSTLQLTGGLIGVTSDNGGDLRWDNFSVTVNAPVPEPATIGLVLGSTGLIGLVIRARRRRK